MSKEVAVKQTGALSTEVLNEWGVPVISSQDIVIPKILPMQGLSVAVAEGRASMGEFRDSLSNNLIGKIDQPFECIPFYVDKCWDIMKEQPDGDFEWDSTVPIVENPASPDYNDNWQWEAVVEGKKVKNVRRFNFYVLLPSELENGGAVPYILSFRSTSFKEGRKLFTQMYMRNIRAGLPPAAYVIKIGGTRQKNDKGIFIVPNYELGRRTTDQELSEALAWIKMIKSGRVKADESDIQGAATELEVSDEGTGAF